MAGSESILQTNYWHVTLEGSRKNVLAALAIFPSPVTTFHEGVFHKNVRAYHSGGAVLINGSRARAGFMDCMFPSPVTLPSVLSYGPINSAGFGFYKSFKDRQLAKEFMQSIDSSMNLSHLEETELKASIKDAEGREYIAVNSSGCAIKGTIASTDIKSILSFYDTLKTEQVGTVGNMKYSPMREFDIETCSIL
ncbi:MAG: hypothetical protein WCI72_04120 [archaeon]